MTFNFSDDGALLRTLQRMEARQPKARRDVPTVPPPIGPQEIFESVAHGRGEWKTLAQAASETAEGEKARKMSERYDLTPIPRPEFEEEDWHL